MNYSANHADEASLEFLVDAHVHIHSCFDVGQQLDAAADNFTMQAENLAVSPVAERVLCLTECSGVNRFEDLVCAETTSNDVPGTRDSEWEFSRNGDGCSIVAVHPRRGRLVIIAGRQIVTSERLEVLGLGATGCWRDGLSIRDTIDNLMNCGAVPVLPWGFGKWLGRRGMVARDLINEYREKALYLGDNSGRLSIAPEPEEFRLGREAGIGVLPGSDALPFEGEYSKTASYGFYVKGVPDCGNAWDSLKSVLLAGQIYCRPYGKLETPLRFLRNQIAMQYRTRIGG